MRVGMPESAISICVSAALEHMFAGMVIVWMLRIGEQGGAEAQYQCLVGHHGKVSNVI